MSSAYLRLLIFLLAILIPACASSSPAFLMMYSAYLNKQGNFRLSTRFLVHHPVTSPSTNQKKVTHLGVLELPRKSSGSSWFFFEQESLTLLAWPLQWTVLCFKLWRFGLFDLTVSGTWTCNQQRFKDTSEVLRSMVLFSNGREERLYIDIRQEGQPDSFLLQRKQSQFQSQKTWTWIRVLPLSR